MFIILKKKVSCKSQCPSRTSVRDKKSLKLKNQSLTFLKRLIPQQLKTCPYTFAMNTSYSVLGMAPEYFVRLKQLIEETHDNNGNQAVMLVSHSMGAPYTVHFLRTVNQAWKDKYIKAWTTISGCFGGSVKAVQAYVSGDGFGIPSILDKPRVLRHFQRTFPSLAFILPDQRFWNKSEVIDNAF